MKDSGYVTKIMGMVSELFYHPGNKTHYRIMENGDRVNIRYTEPFYLHWKYRNLVDDHYGKMHAPIIKGSLKTQRWAMRVFQYGLATTESNFFLAHKNFGEGNMQILEFRRELAWESISQYEECTSSVSTRASSNPLTHHKEATCPTYTSHWSVLWDSFTLPVQLFYLQTCWLQKASEDLLHL